MVKLTQSLAHWLWKKDPNLVALISFGHLEVLTPEMYREYIEWCQTEEGRQYLKGGSKYDAEYAKRNGIE
jgi:hypothetical protein